MCVGARTTFPAPIIPPRVLRRPRLPREVVASPRVDLNRLWEQLEPIVACHVSWSSSSPRQKNVARPHSSPKQQKTEENDGDDDNAANENRLNEQRERAQKERDRERRRQQGELQSPPC